MCALRRLPLSVKILIEFFRSVASLVVSTAMPSLGSPQFPLFGACVVSSVSRLFLGLHFGARASISFWVVSKHLFGCLHPLVLDASLHELQAQKFVFQCSVGMSFISSVSCFM